MMRACLKRKTLLPGIIASLLMLFGLSSCYMEVREDSRDWQRPQPNPLPMSMPSSARVCSDHDSHENRTHNARGTQSCFQDIDYTWHTSCRGRDCQEVEVYVHYMLSHNLGNGHTVNIEAFDNPRFNGSPVSSVQVNRFTAEKPGDHQSTQLFLSAGTYYLRAYISRENETVTPYQYHDMELVSERPMGIYGAISSPTQVVLYHGNSGHHNQTVHINLDQLFRSAENEQNINAYLRIKFSTEEINAIPTYRRLVIQLHQSTDLYRRPVYQFTLPTEALLVSGREGEAEFISPSLMEENYFIFAYIDEDDNGFYDEGELAKFFERDARPASISIQANRTQPVQMQLTTTPNIPNLW